MQLGDGALLGLLKSLQGTISMFLLDLWGRCGSRDVAEGVPDADAWCTTDPLIVF
jgi:hypothetical protein